MRAGLFLAPLLFACSGCWAPPASPQLAEAPPRPPPPASLSAPLPAVSAAPVSPPATQPSASAEPLAPKACVSPASPKKNGVVSDDRIEALGDADLQETPGLDGAAQCVAALKGNGDPDLARKNKCAWDDIPIVLGFDPAHDRMAALMVRELPTAGEECPATEGQTLDVSTGKRISTKGWPVNPSCNGYGLGLSTFADETKRGGFTVPARSLVMKQATLPVGATAYRPVAVLDAPLCGWMIQVVKKGARFAVEIVSPGNDWSAPLGTLPVERGSAYPSVRQVALAPDRKRIVMLLATTPGGHNEPLRFQLATFALPPRALPASAGDPAVPQ